MIGALLSEKLVYYPTVTREPFRHNGRISLLLSNGKLAEDVGLPQIDTASDRFMLCGSPAMLADIRAILDARGFMEGNHGEPGHYVIEKAFAEWKIELPSDENAPRSIRAKRSNPFMERASAVLHKEIC